MQSTYIRILQKTEVLQLSRVDGCVCVVCVCVVCVCCVCVCKLFLLSYLPTPLLPFLLLLFLIIISSFSSFSSSSSSFFSSPFSFFSSFYSHFHQLSLFNKFNTLSVMYMQPSSEFITQEAPYVLIGDTHKPGTHTQTLSL